MEIKLKKRLGKSSRRNCPRSKPNCGQNALIVRNLWPNGTQRVKIDSRYVRNDVDEGDVKYHICPQMAWPKTTCTSTTLLYIIYVASRAYFKTYSIQGSILLKTIRSSLGH